MFVKNTDNVLQVVVKGSNGLPLTISSMAKLEIILYQGEEKIVERFSTADSNIVTVNDAGGIVRAYIQRKNMRHALEANSYIEVIGWFADVNFAGGLRRESSPKNKLQFVHSSPTENEKV